VSFQKCKIAGIGVNSELYHAQKGERGTAEFIMSPSSIKAFSECPSRWKAGYNSPDSEAKDWGNLLDVLLLTPESFQERFAVKPATYPTEPSKKGGEVIQKPFNSNSTWCREWIESQGNKVVISQKELADAISAKNRLMADETIAAFHAACDKQVHVAGQWKDDKTGIIIPVQCLIDFVGWKESEFQKSLGDLKTTRNAGQRVFSRWCYTAGYHIQAAFDIDLYTAATGEGRTDWIFILQENYAPFETGRRLLSQDLLQIGRQTYEHALSRYARCLKTGEWSGYDPADEFSLIQAEPWMEFNALSEAMEHEQIKQMETDDTTP
jgi:hypothetical protein